MKLILPPGLSSAQFERAMKAFAGVIGDDWVLRTDADRETYLDQYSPGLDESHAPSAAIAPASVEQVQAVLRLANEHHVPLWPISRGKNFGYGGAAPRMPGTVMLDLGRLNRIIEVNDKLNYCILEPGVGFFDLYEYLKERRIPLQMGIPGNGWGSVIGQCARARLLPHGRSQQQHLRAGDRAADGRARAYRHGRHGRKQGVAAVQTWFRSVVGPDDRSRQLRRRHQAVPVDAAG